MLAQPAVAVVPAANLVAVQALKLRGEYRVKVIIGESADRRIAGVQGDVFQIVQPGEQADLREHRDAGDKHEPDMSGTALDDAVEPPEVIPVRPRQFQGCPSTSRIGLSYSSTSTTTC